MHEIKRLLNKKNITALAVAVIINLLGFVIMQPDMDSELYKKQKQGYVEGYHKSIMNVIKQADNMMMFDIFVENNEVSIKNIEKTKLDYERVKDLQLTMDNDRVTQSVLGYTYISIITVVLMLYIIYNTCNERKNGMMQITYSAYGGRKKLALKRSLFFFAAPFVTVILLYIINTVVACIMYGIDDFGGPVQTISAFNNYTYLHSKGEYLVISAIKNAFFTSVLTLIVYMVCNIFYNIGISLLLIGAVFVGEWWLFANIPGTSVFKNLKNINVFVLFDGNYFDREYLNVNLFGSCIGAGTILLVGSIILLIISFVLSIVLYRKFKGQLPRFIKKILEIIEIGSQKLLEKLPYSLKELWKLLVIKKGILLGAAVVFAFFIIWDNSVAKFGQRNTEIDGLYNQYGGTNWEGFEAYVEDFSAMIDDKFAEAQRIIDGINAGTEDISRLLEVEVLTNRAEAAQKYLEEYEEKLAYRQTMKEQRDIDIQLVADRKMDAAFGQRSDRREILYGIVVIVFVILVTSWAFEVEQKAGIMSIVAPTNRGAAWVYRKKYIVLISTVMAGVFFVYGCDIFNLVKTYSLQSFDAPVQSVYFWENIDINISICGYVALIFATRIVYALIIQGLTMLFGSGRYVCNRSYTLLFMIGASIVFVLLNEIGYIAKLIFICAGIVVYMALVLIAYKNWRKY